MALIKPIYYCISKHQGYSYSNNQFDEDDTTVKLHCPEKK